MEVWSERLKQSVSLSRLIGFLWINSFSLHFIAESARKQAREELKVKSYAQAMEVWSEGLKQSVLLGRLIGFCGLIHFSLHFIAKSARKQLKEELKVKLYAQAMEVWS